MNGKVGADGKGLSIFDRVRVRKWWTDELPRVFGEIPPSGCRRFGPRRPGRAGESGGRNGEAGAPEGTSAAEGATPVGRRDFGLAEEIARVERAALDWGVHADALEGRFMRALLKAIEETGKTNLATLGDLEALLERARREGEADRRRIERMIEAGSNALGDGASRLRETPVWRARAPNRWSMNLVAGIQAECRRRSWKGAPMADLRTESAASALRMETGGMGGGWRRGAILCRRAPRCNGGVRRRVRRVRPCSKRSIAVGLSR